MPGQRRLLILGGTSEAMRLARLVRGRNDLSAIYSLAGRVADPVRPPIETRIGGFGGVAGLVDYLGAEKIDAVIDATHPFAAQMSRHAAEGCWQAGVALCALTRPAWQKRDGDHWIEVADMPAAVAALGNTPRRVFLTVGGQHLNDFSHAPQHRYVVRSIERPAAIGELPDHVVVLARPPFSVEDETALMREHAIDIVVTKNSGAAATAAKLDAARALAIPVVMIGRPKPSEVETVATPEDALAWIDVNFKR